MLLASSPAPKHLVNQRSTPTGASCGNSCFWTAQVCSRINNDVFLVTDEIGYKIQTIRSLISGQERSPMNTRGKNCCFRLIFPPSLGLKIRTQTTKKRLTGQEK